MAGTLTTETKRRERQRNEEMKLLTPKTSKPGGNAGQDHRGTAPVSVKLTDPRRTAGEASEGEETAGRLPDSVRRRLSGDSAQYLDSVRLESNGE